MQADIKLAIVPASIARIPNLASWPRCSGASRPDAANLNADGAELAKAASAKVAMVRSSVEAFLSAAELGRRRPLSYRHARPNTADSRFLRLSFQGMADQHGDGRKNPAEELLEALRDAGKW